MLNINKYNKSLPCQTGTNMYLCTVFSAEYAKKQAQLIDCPKIMRNFAARNRKRLDK
ncbi:MAG: hypothetical protein PARBB_03866 [Parabacteroides distasonis]